MPQTTLLVYRNAADEVPLLEWLEVLESTKTKAYAKCLERILQLERSGFELRRPAADVLRDGVWELRAKFGRVQYRILYFFCGKNEACLTHGFSKEGAVPDVEIERAVAAKKQVTANRGKHTVEWEL